MAHLLDGPARLLDNLLSILAGPVCSMNMLSKWGQAYRPAQLLDRSLTR